MDQTVYSTCMICVLMSITMRYMFKSFPAYIAWIWLKSCVDARVCSEVISKKELLATLFALMIPFLQMISFYMNLKQKAYLHFRSIYENLLTTYKIRSYNEGWGYIYTFLCPKLLNTRSQSGSVQVSSVVIPSWTVILCFRNVDFQANFSSHKSHFIASVSSCIAICWWTDSILVKVCWQTLHSNFDPSSVILTSPYLVWTYLPPFFVPKVVEADNSVKCGDLMESLVGEDVLAGVLRSLWRSFSMLFDTSPVLFPSFSVAPL